MIETDVKTSYLIHQLAFTIQTGSKIPVKNYKETKQNVVIITDDDVWDGYNHNIKKLEKIYKKSCHIKVKLKDTITIEAIKELTIKYNTILFNFRDKRKLHNFIEKNNIYQLTKELNTAFIFCIENQSNPLHKYTQISNYMVKIKEDANNNIQYHVVKSRISQYFKEELHINKEYNFINGDKYNKKCQI